jgi:hypothetical protein
MYRILFYQSCVAALILTAPGCRGTTSATAEGCIRNVEVVVLPGTNPAFAWSPSCGISSLSVVTVPSAPGVSEEAMWAFSVPENSPIGPAIRYGSAPNGATVWTQSRALVTGATYRVRVALTVGGDGLLGHGDRVFTR